ncbi:hypothetical protein L2Y94_06540 [Luteibacter aegosomatis]|uniref:hypothetical protein n=1 Tax=Luteibacter aegosomatis TaxID=2911537 RepID=UPI001FFA2EF1|nr:hypothetical protein [Luteibacter aegosomatis]UPG87009.1 hypothetical protein L2Y94_06540 [Luteibacter aegosomatis]
MKVVKLIGVFMMAVVAGGCDIVADDASRAGTGEITSIASLDTDQTAKEAEYALQALCPSLGKLAGAGEIDSVSHQVGEPNMDTQRAVGWATATTVTVILPNRALNSVPSDWHAAGQHCHFEVGADGIAVAKSACMRICDIEPNGSTGVKRFQ